MELSKNSTMFHVIFYVKMLVIHLYPLNAKNMAIFTQETLILWMLCVIFYLYFKKQ